MQLDINIGDIVLGGKFKNHRIEVKSIGEDELGQPIINEDRKLLAVRIEKKLPEGMWSSESLAKKYKEKNMDKQATLEEVYNASFNDELEKIGLSINTILRAALKSHKKVLPRQAKMRKSMNDVINLHQKFGVKRSRVRDNVGEMLSDANQMKRRGTILYEPNDYSDLKELRKLKKELMSGKHVNINS